MMLLAKIIKLNLNNLIQFNNKQNNKFEINFYSYYSNYYSIK